MTTATQASEGTMPASWSREASVLMSALRADRALPSASLRRLIAELITPISEGTLPAVWHPTGFLVLALHHDELGALRLHLWPADARVRGQPCWPVHDHVWSLRSQVLCGRVHSHDYEVVDDPEGEAVLYAVDYDRDHRSCMRRSARRVAVRAGVPRHVAAPARYEVEAGAFHASQVAAGDFAATLVATRRTDRAHPWVVGPGDGPAVVPVVRPRAEAGDVRAMLLRVASALA